MKKLALLSLLALSSCTQRGCQETKRSFGTSERTYDVKLYSGGSVVYEDSFKGIVNQENGDGFFYYKGDTLIEIAGDYILKSVD